MMSYKSRIKVLLLLAAISLISTVSLLYILIKTALNGGTVIININKINEMWIELTIYITILLLQLYLFIKIIGDTND